MNEQIQYDTIIIGGAAAGLTAAIYASRRGLSTLVLTKDIGGQAALSDEIENYPGINKAVKGFELMREFQKQAEKFGAKIQTKEVTRIVPQNKSAFEVCAGDKSYYAKTVILAFGMTPKNLNIEGEQKFQGKGVAYCATCDAPMYKGKDVLVVGNSTPALDATMVLANIGAKSVIIITEKDQLSGNEKLIAQLEKLPNVTIETQTTLTEIQGSQFIESVKGMSGDSKKEWSVQGVFVELGHTVKTDFVQGIIELDERQHIIIDEHNMTSKPGIFAAGDVTTEKCKQVVVSAGEGCKAALHAYNYLQEEGEVKPKGVDWGIV